MSSSRIHTKFARALGAAIITAAITGSLVFGTGAAQARPLDPQPDPQPDPSTGLASYTLT